MPTSTTYQQLAQAYAAGARALLAPAAPLAGERSITPVAKGPVARPSPVGDLRLDLADQAEQLAPLAADFTQAAAAQLADPDPQARLQASTGLLAKALADLEISARLLQAAEDEEDQPPVGDLRLARPKVVAAERSVSTFEAPGDYLDLLSGAPAAAPVAKALERGPSTALRTSATVPADVETARTQLATAVEDTLDLVRDKVAKTGQSALGGLLGLGAGELAQAAGLVGMNVAQALGQAEKVTRLYELFRQFALSAYDSLVALIGPALAQGAAKQVVSWVGDLAKGEQFGKLLDRLYETGKTNQALGELVAGSQADLLVFAAAIQGLDNLDTAYRQQAGLIEKLLKGLKLLAIVPAAALPQGQLLLAAAYIALGGYVVLAGADYVDAQKLKLLNRTPGVRQIVESKLAAATER
jgi:hypothetical protein